MITTSNFAKSKHLEPSTLLDITRFPPKWISSDIVRATELAPDGATLMRYKSSDRTKQDQLIYTEEYLDKLNRLGIEYISKLCDHRTLLCYCKSDAFCHRHILCDFLNDNGILCSEL